MKIFAIETSCDETAAAIVENGRKILSNVVHSQIADHSKFGGVVPEIASRKHCEKIDEVAALCFQKANLTIDEIDAVAVTNSPGLVGSLIVGVNFAKGLAFAANKPLIAVNHIISHIAANYLSHPDLKPPFLSLIISGGHCNIVHVKTYCSFSIIAKTRDDAVGETFDKIARAIGFKYPGGAKLEKLAQDGDEFAFNFPKPFVAAAPLDFSFSGLKIAVLNLINNSKNNLNLPDVAASFQRAICESVSSRIVEAANKLNLKKLAIAGGVSSNLRIRQFLSNIAEEHGIELFIPKLNLCTDNAAMVGSQGFYEFLNKNFADSSLNASANCSFA